jgi:hypothetical protein
LKVELTFILRGHVSHLLLLQLPFRSRDHARWGSLDV